MFCLPFIDSESHGTGSSEYRIQKEENTLAGPEDDDTITGFLRNPAGPIDFSALAEAK